MSFQISVRMLNGASESLQVAATDTILSLKEKIEDRTGLPTAIQRLICCGNELKDDATISVNSLGLSLERLLLFATQSYDCFFISPLFRDISLCKRTLLFTWYSVYGSAIGLPNSWVGCGVMTEA